MKKLEITLETLNQLAEIKDKIMNKYPEPEGIVKIDVDRLIQFANEPLRVDFREVIDNLSQNQKRELSAIVWLGRGDFSNFQAAYDHASTFDGEDAASYIEGKPLSKYIPRGIAALKKEGINLS